MSDPAHVCPWCSAELSGPTEERCPSCGAALRESDGSEVPGVTRIDHEAILRSRAPAQRSRGLMGWLAGEYQVDKPTEPPETYAPPPEDVRREMLRLELAALEAEVLGRQAEAAALAADAVEAGADSGDDAGDEPAADDVETWIGAEPEEQPRDG